MFFWPSLHAQGYFFFLFCCLPSPFSSASSCFSNIAPQSMSYVSIWSWTKLIPKVWRLFFFFNKRFLDKIQRWLQLEAAGISVPCFNAWPLSWNPGEFLGVGVEEREKRREPLHPKWDSEEFTAVFSGDLYDFIALVPAVTTLHGVQSWALAKDPPSHECWKEANSPASSGRKRGLASVGGGSEERQKPRKVSKTLQSHSLGSAFKQSWLWVTFCHWLA